jgi:hypothetical protein
MSNDIMCEFLCYRFRPSRCIRGADCPAFNMACMANDWPLGATFVRSTVALRHLAAANDDDAEQLLDARRVGPRCAAGAPSSDEPPARDLSAALLRFAPPVMISVPVPPGGGRGRLQVHTVAFCA